MKNLDNALRLYNRKVLRRTKMHLYTKRYIDTLYHKAIFKIPRVNVIRWTEDDIAQFKLDGNRKRFDDGYTKTPVVPVVDTPEAPVEKNEYEPPTKKPKVDENGKSILKLVLSREGETDTFKSQFKTSDDDKENGKKNDKKNGKKINKKNIAEGEKKRKKNNDQENEMKNNLNKDQEIEKKNDENTKQGNAMLFDNESSNSSTEPMEIVCDEPLETTKSTTPIIGTIRCCDMTKLIDPTKLEKYYECFNVPQKFGKLSKSNEKKSSNASKNPVLQNSVAKNLALSEIERLYHKYFKKSVQDNIVIIANILNIISMSNKHHKARMDESFKKKTEAEKLKERCDANRMHLRHRKILESKLKKYFMEVVSEFNYSEFEPVFQMFFLSILTVLRILDQPKFKKGSIFKNLVLLLWNSLKNSELDHPKVFGMFRSKTFRPDCIDLISQIEDSRDNDPGITDRMSLFFVSSVNTKEYFDNVVNAVTGDANEDLGLLIDNAAFKSCINSKFKGSLETPSSAAVMKKNIIVKSPVTSVQSTSTNDDSFKRWVLAKTPSGTYQPVTMNDGQPKKRTPIIIDPSRAGKHLNNYIEDFSNSLLHGTTSTPMTKKIIVPKGAAFTSTPSVSNGSLPNGSTIVAIKSTIQTMKPVSTSYSRTEGGNTILFGNKQYHLIRSPVNQLRTVTAQNGIVMASMVKKPEVSIKCFAKSCQNAATIMCSTCRSVKYCSHNCQRLDWYEAHINNCERLNTIRLSREDPKNSSF